MWCQWHCWKGLDVTFCRERQEEEPQTTYPMSFAWASHLADIMHYGMEKHLRNQSINQSINLRAWTFASQLKWHQLCLNFLRLFTYCVRLHDKKSQRACPMSITWASHMADNMLIQDVKLYPINLQLKISKWQICVCDFHIVCCILSWDYKGGARNSPPLVPNMGDSCSRYTAIGLVWKLYLKSNTWKQCASGWR